jgi:hypothetical protein
MFAVSFIPYRHRVFSRIFHLFLGTAVCSARGAAVAATGNSGDTGFPANGAAIIATYGYLATFYPSTALPVAAIIASFK